ncbi:hypothetical protein [Leptospira weilii]|uniref:hypothetical protein n=1 Tax=Leptospira weilii TaxID=28184 RepID=UPI00056CC410|nr:hypothetical protein [Leptospira weilii]
MQNVNYRYERCTKFELVANGIGKKIKSATAVYFRACLPFKEFYFDSGLVPKTERKKGRKLFLEIIGFQPHGTIFARKVQKQVTLELEISD